ncbi:hypothetical protein [Gorillibacterium massiliense]|uniref:hypothetical protein n=1 Tax=Gorillibacterium massiliense TaxID=1280390 RepID=UPI0004B68FC3|nr:hypothetical protein [Gorillibacterium massiliense]
MNKNSNFDERQKQIRGSVFQTGYVFLALFFLVDAMVKQSGHVWADYADMAMIGIMASVTFCSIILIIKNSYAGTSPAKWQLLVFLITVASVLSIVFGANDLPQYGYLTDGHITDASRTLIIGLLLFIIAAVYWIKQAVAKLTE